jgi:FdhE protein
MTASVESVIRDLGHQRPEWEPWLTVIRDVIEEADDARWEAAIPNQGAAPESKAPLLAATVIAIETTGLRRWTERLFETASRSGTEKMATLKGVIRGTAPTLPLFKASLCQDNAALKHMAAAGGADPEAFQAVAALLPVPFLHACKRRWSNSLPQGWVEGYCPICGAWPAFAEVRGIERSRYFRCGRCAGEWPFSSLVCAYCGMTDHRQLVSLIPEQSGAARVIEACKRCLGYVKTFTTLQASPASKIILDDLASVDLDIAALAHEFKRPQGLGYRFDVKVIDKPAKQFLRI